MSPGAVRFIALTVAFAVVGGLAYVNGRRDQKATTTTTAIAARVDTVLIVRAARIDTLRVVTRVTRALHDTVRLISANRVEVPGPTVTSPPDTVVVPSVLIRRVVADSLTILAQARVIVSDSAAIRALQLQVRSIPVQRWYHDRFSVGPSYNVSRLPDGRVIGAPGISIQIRLFSRP